MQNLLAQVNILYSEHSGAVHFHDSSHLIRMELMLVACCGLCIYCEQATIVSPKSIAKS